MSLWIWEPGTVSNITYTATQMFGYNLKDRDKQVFQTFLKFKIIWTKTRMLAMSS